MKAIDRVRLQTAVEEVINQKEDQALIIDLGPREEAARAATTVLGKPLTAPIYNGVMVI